MSPPLAPPLAPHSGPHSARPAATGPHRLTVLPLGVQLPVSPGQSLLQAALAAGVRLPSACRNGTCRACLARLVQGSIHYLIDWPGLLAEEKADGWILPCVASAAGDLVINAPAASALAGAANPAHQPAGHRPGR